MANERAYHVMLNGKGYIVLDESYAVQPQRAFNPRFSTGDPSLGDLSFWQFLSQESFAGGAEQEIFETTNKIEGSYGWDFRDGKARLCRNMIQVFANAALDVSYLPQTSKLNPTHFVDWAGKLYLCGEPLFGTGDADCSRISLSTTPPLSILETRHAVAGHRGGTGTFSNAFLMCAYEDSGAGNDRVIFFDTGFGTLLNYPLTSMTDVDGVCQIGNNRMMAFGRGYITFLDFTTGSWGAPTEIYTRAGSLLSYADTRFLNGYGVDSSANFYLIANFTGETTNVNEGPGSTICVITAADATATNPRVSALVKSSYEFTRIESLNGSVYMFGSERVSGSKYQPIIVKYPNTVVYRGPRVEEVRASFTRENYFIRATWATADGIYFLAPNRYDQTKTSIMKLRSDDTVIEAQGHLSSTGFSSNKETVTHDALALHNGFFHLYAVSPNNFYRTSYSFTAGAEQSKRGGLTGKDATYINGLTLPGAADGGTEAWLALSKFGGNTPLIEKSLFELTVELSEAIPENGYLDVYIGSALIKRISSRDGTTIAIQPEEETTSSSFQPIFRSPLSMFWDGYISKVTIRYIPTQFKKLAWGFAVRAHNNLKLLNGQFEKRDATTLIEDLKEAWSANQPLDFTDLDGKKYKVIVTEFKARQPLTADKRDDREYLIPIELLEV